MKDDEGLFDSRTEDTLRELKIADELIEAFLGITASHHDDVLNL